MKLCRTPRRRHRLLEMIGSRAARAMGCPFERTGSPLWRGPGRPLRAVPYALPGGKTARRVQIRTAQKHKLEISVFIGTSQQKNILRDKRYCAVGTCHTCGTPSLPELHLSYRSNKKINTGGNETGEYDGDRKIVKPTFVKCTPDEIG